LLRYTQAESLLKRALSIRKEIFGPRHPAVGESLNDLASVYIKQGRYSEAEELCDQCLTIQEEMLGPEHPAIAATLMNMERLYRIQENYISAKTMAKRAFEIRRKNFIDNVLALSEREALSCSRALRTSAHAYLSSYCELTSPDSSAVRNAVEIILCTKGEVSDEVFERQNAVMLATDTNSIAIAQSLKRVKFQLSRLFVEGPRGQSDQYRAKQDSLSNLADELEAEFSRSNANFRMLKDTKNISSTQILSKLGERDVLLEFVKYNRFQSDLDSPTPHYLVTVLSSGMDPAVVSLGNAAEIDSLINEYRQHILRVSRLNRIPWAVQQDYEDLSKRLLSRIWQPIESFIADRKLVLIAPDGALSMVSFAGLIGSDGKYLIENHALHYLSSGRDIVRFRDRPSSAIGLLALADPDYDAPVHLRELKVNDNSTESRFNQDISRGFRSTCDGFRNMSVGSLPGTRTEVELIVQNWTALASEPLSVYLGPSASEDRFKAEAPGTRIIHLATHGYFLGHECYSIDSDLRLDPDIGSVRENPLLLSGLFFAGANLHGKGTSGTLIEDGILTAYEVSAMNLSGTDLVVLSACETGLGEVEDGEGVYGLRRAFQMAGARTIISGLCPISDKTTAEMMSKVYDTGNKPLPETMRNIQFERIKDLRSKNEFDHPYSWGGFICLGDWR